MEHSLYFRLSGANFPSRVGNQPSTFGSPPLSTNDGRRVVFTNPSRRPEQGSSPSQETETPSTPTQWHSRVLFFFYLALHQNPHVSKLTWSRFIFNSPDLYVFHQVWVCLLGPAVKRWIPKVASWCTQGTHEANHRWTTFNSISVC